MLCNNIMVFVPSRPSTRRAHLLLHLSHPYRRPSRRSQQEEEAQDGHQLQDHGHGAKPRVVPDPGADLLLDLLLVQASQLVPSVMRQFTHSCAGNYDKRRCADKRDQVQWEEDDKFDNLNQAPWVVFGSTGRSAQLFDRARLIREEDAVRRDEVDQAVVDKRSL